MTVVVGVTGNIASGKSTVSSMLGARGATVIDADQLARDALAQGTRALAAVAARWPSAISAGGVLDRRTLGRIVFADPAARAELNAIVHPEVARRRDAALESARNRGDDIIIYDVPLLFEAGLEHDVDTIVLVDAPESVRRARLMSERALSEADANAMIAAQMPAAEKRSRAHYVIENDASMEMLAARVSALWEALAKGVPRG